MLKPVYRVRLGLDNNMTIPQITGTFNQFMLHIFAGVEIAFWLVEGSERIAETALILAALRLPLQAIRPINARKINVVIPIGLTKEICRFVKPTECNI